MKKRIHRGEVTFKLALLAFFALLYVLALPYPEKSKQFPQLLADFSFILIVISLVVDFTGRSIIAGEMTDAGETELKVPEEREKRSRRKRFYRAWGVILISTAIGFLGGFLFSTFSLFMGFALVFGERTGRGRMKNFVTAVAMTALIYFIFDRMMGVPLLGGIFS